MSPWKRRFLLKTIIFRFHVKFRGCTPLFSAIMGKNLNQSWRSIEASQLLGGSCHEKWFITCFSHQPSMGFTKKSYPRLAALYFGGSSQASVVIAAPDHKPWISARCWGCHFRKWGADVFSYNPKIHLDWVMMLSNKTAVANINH